MKKFYFIFWQLSFILGRKANILTTKNYLNVAEDVRYISY